MKAGYRQAFETTNEFVRIKFEEEQPPRAVVPDCITFAKHPLQDLLMP